MTVDAPPRSDDDEEVRSLPIDPRMRQRLVEIKRHEGRRRLRILLAGVGLVVVAAALYGISRSPLLHVRGVDVVGIERTARADVVRAAGLDHDRPLTSVDPDAVRRGVRGLPWIDRVAVSRSWWPRTVAIRVTERRPAAVTPAAGGGWATVDASGRVLAVDLTPAGGLPRLAGVRPAGRPGTTIPDGSAGVLGVARSLPPLLRSRLTEVAVVGDGLELRLTGGTVVRLGSASDLQAKLLAAETVLGRVEVAGTSVLDVRVPDAPVLTTR